MRLFVSVFFLLVYLNAFGQVGAIRNWIDSEVKLSDSKGNLVKVTHSLPKGGGEVYQNGTKYSYVIFWTRMSNQSKNPVDLKVHFPNTTYFKSPDSYIKIVLPREAMHIEKEQLYDYGLTNLQSLLNDESKRLNVLHKIIQPKKDYIFYIAVFIHISGWGPSRAKFELKGKDLIYKINMGPETTFIPCGSLDFNHSK